MTFPWLRWNMVVKLSNLKHSQPFYPICLTSIKRKPGRMWRVRSSARTTASRSAIQF